MKFDPRFLLRLFLGFVFLSAGTYRIFHWQEALAEISTLHLPLIPLMSFLVITLEIIGGLMLIFNLKSKWVVMVFTVFLAITLLQTLLFSLNTITANFGELFFYSLTPTDFFLHVTYLVILLYLFLAHQQNNSK